MSHAIDVTGVASGPAGLGLQSTAASSIGTSSKDTTPLKGSTHLSSLHVSPMKQHKPHETPNRGSSGSGDDLEAINLEDEIKPKGWMQRHIVAPFKKKIVTPMVNILKSGATPEGIALSLAFGLTGGVFPVPATTTVICVAFVFLFRLNLAAVQITNLLMTPVNLATFITFIRWGEWIFGVDPMPLSLEPFKTKPLEALAQFWVSLCYGVVAWAIFTPPATAIAYVILKPVLRRAMANVKFS
jgi:uncharacterized protein (DUF2062 family)